MRATPAANGNITLKTERITGFFMRIQPLKRRYRMQAIKHVDHFAGHHMQLSTQLAQRPVKFAQAFKNELVMLIRSVRRHPQAGLDDVKTKHRTALRRCVERGMVTGTQIALEPDDAIVGGVRKKFQFSH